MTLKGVARRLDRLEHDAHQRTLAELAKRRGVLRWVIVATDAEPDPAWPGHWRSETLDMLGSLPRALRAQALRLMEDEGLFVEPTKLHDDERD